MPLREAARRITDIESARKFNDILAAEVSRLMERVDELETVVLNVLDDFQRGVPVDVVGLMGTLELQGVAVER